MNNSTSPVSSEDVMAYVDGQLPPERAAAVAQAIADDERLQREMDDYVASAAALKHAYDDVLAEPVPDHLKKMVMSEEDNKIVPMRRKPRAPIPVWQQALAASVLVAVGLFVGANWIDQTPVTLSAMTVGELNASHPLDDALERMASGDRETVGAEDVHILQSFLTGDGTVCREYEVTSESRGATGIACRRNDQWQVAVVVEGAIGDTGGRYQPASGASQAAIDEAYIALEAGDGLMADLESCLIQNNWNVSGCANE